MLQLETQAFVATFSKPPRGLDHNRLVISGVRGLDGWDVRIERFTAKQAFTEPSRGLLDQVHDLLASAIDDGWGQVLVQTPEEDIQVLQSQKNGKLRRTISKKPASRTQWDRVATDRIKSKVLVPDRDAAFLHALDVATPDGKITAPMADKYRQINHLLDTVITDVGSVQKLRIADLGCGKAYLSLSLFYVLQQRGVDVELLGVDANPHVVEHCNRVAKSLGFSNARFICSTISNAPSHPVDVVLALHACDTATDDAIACALRCTAKWMYIAPCCHHSVQVQLTKNTVPEWARPLLDDGITKERLGDLLTDTMRRDMLRANGYNAHLEEFVSLEHTQKNILLRATFTNSRADIRQRWAKSVQDYATAWGINLHWLSFPDATNSIS